MIIIMQGTVEYVIELSKTPNVESSITESINELWKHVTPDNMRITKDEIKYVKIEL